MWKCPICGEITSIGMAIGTPTCSKDGSTLIPSNDSSMPQVTMPPVSIGGKVSVGGNLHNSGKLKVFPNGEININKDLFNTGDISVNDPERFKELLVQVVKTSGSLAELGSNIIKTFIKS